MLLTLIIVSLMFLALQLANQEKLLERIAIGVERQQPKEPKP
jgi:hypothetical protein